MPSSDAVFRLVYHSYTGNPQLKDRLYSRSPCVNPPALSLSFHIGTIFKQWLVDSKAQNVVQLQYRLWGFFVDFEKKMLPEISLRPNLLNNAAALGNSLAITQMIKTRVTI